MGQLDIIISAYYEKLEYNYQVPLNQTEAGSIKAQIIQRKKFSMNRARGSTEGTCWFWGFIYCPD